MCFFLQNECKFSSSEILESKFNFWNKISLRAVSSCPNQVSVTFNLSDSTLKTFLPMNVVYFDQLSGTACTQKLVKLLFSVIYKLFCSFITFFSNFTPEINKKGLKMNKKTCFCLLLKAGRHAKAGRLPEGVPPICLFSVDFLLF